MNLAVEADYEAMSAAAASHIARALKRKPRLLLCLATGQSPARAYDLLSLRARRSPALFSKVRVLKLDEWEGLPANDPRSCENYLRQRVVRPWRVAPNRFLGFKSSRNPNTETRRLNAWLERHGPIDLCILGLGQNGHLGLNEPASALQPLAHRARLSPATRRHPMLQNPASKPTHGLTIGLAQILQSTQIFLLVSGAPKRKPLRALLHGEISTAFPASFLNLHPHTTIFCDRAALP